jgi:hypothetical protein
MRAEFRVHRLTEDGIAKARLLAEVFERALADIEHFAGEDGREMAIVRTKMEEACFFAKKAMANRPENQEPEPF